VNKVDISRIREDLPAAEQNWVYLDNAAGSIPPIQTIQAVNNYFMNLAGTGPISKVFYEDTLRRVSDAKQTLAAMLGAKDAEEIAFTMNGSEALNIAINGIDWSDGDEVITSSLESTSGFIPLLRLSSTKRITVRVAEQNVDGIVGPDTIEALMTARTRLIALIHVSNSVGTIQPVEEVGRLAEAHGVMFLVNASQSVGQMPVNVQELNCDFLAAPCRKWMRGPQGLGFLYCRSTRLRELEPSYIGWNTTNLRPDGSGYEHTATAGRFEAGEPNYPAIVGLKRSLEYTYEVGGLDQIRARIRQLTQYCIERLGEIKHLRIYGTADQSLRAGIVPFNIEGVEPKEIETRLAERSITIEAGAFATPLALKSYGASTWARISIHYFNTKEEIDQLVDALEEMI
jgi:cysteine desulfurase/selenocysteine lyase